MYRPTVRYDDIYKTYVDQVFKATTLDRNQIIRLALFAAPFSPLFNAQLEKYMTSPPPSPLWEAMDHGLWMEQTQFEKEGGKDVNGRKEEIRREERTIEHPRIEQTPRRTGEVRQERQPNGGIKIFFN